MKIIVIILKINLDAAVNKNEGRLGIGIIARDINKCIMAARSTTKRIEVEPDVVEAIAALNVVILIKEMGYRDVTLEGDVCIDHCEGDRF
jgi:ribonuclease HI